MTDNFYFFEKDRLHLGIGLDGGYAALSTNVAGDKRPAVQYFGRLQALYQLPGDGEASHWWPELSLGMTTVGLSGTDRS